MIEWKKFSGTKELEPGEYVLWKIWRVLPEDEFEDGFLVIGEKKETGELITEEHYEDYLEIYEIDEKGYFDHQKSRITHYSKINDPNETIGG